MGESALRVTHVIGGLGLGGAETLLFRLAGYPLPGVEQQVICLGGPGWYSPLLEERGVRVDHLGISSPLAAMAKLRELRRLLHDRNPDVVQSWMYVANLLSALAARGSGTPVVWGIHNSSFEQVGLPSRLSAYAGGMGARRLARFVINCSQHSAELHERLGYSAAENAVIPNGYDPAVFRPDPKARAATRGALAVDEDMFLVGSISRWHPHKDVPNLLRAVRIAADEIGRLQCLLIGDGLGSDNDELTRAIRAAGCEHLVQPLGRRAGVPDLARAMDLHVLSSRSEAFPNVAAETMLSGTPNVVTATGDSAAIVGPHGGVVPPRDPQRLARAIVEAWREWSGDPERWRARREASRQRIAGSFTFERMAEAYAAIWRRAGVP